MVAEKIQYKFKIGGYAQVSPELTNLDEWVKGKIIDLIDNPFIGLEVAIQDEEGCIFYGEARFFKPIK